MKRFAFIAAGLLAMMIMIVAFNRAGSTPRGGTGRSMMTSVVAQIENRSTITVTDLDVAITANAITSAPPSTSIAGGSSTAFAADEAPGASYTIKYKHGGNPFLYNGPITDGFPTTPNYRMWVDSGGHLWQSTWWGGSRQLT